MPQKTLTTLWLRSSHNQADFRTREPTLYAYIQLPSHTTRSGIISYNSETSKRNTETIHNLIKTPLESTNHSTNHSINFPLQRLPPPRRRPSRSMIRSPRLSRTRSLLPGLPLDITYNLFALTHNLINDLLRLSTGFLHGLDIGALGRLLGRCSGSGSSLGLADTS